MVDGLSDPSRTWLIGHRPWGRDAQAKSRMGLRLEFAASFSGGGGFGEDQAVNASPVFLIGPVGSLLKTPARVSARERGPRRSAKVGAVSGKGDRMPGW